MEALNITVDEKVFGGIAFRGDFPTIYRVNLWSRVGSRLLIKMHEFPYNGKASLYKEVNTRISWHSWFSVDQTFAVYSIIPNMIDIPGHYANLLVKDAVADKFRHKLGKRPSVYSRHPEIQIELYIGNGVAKVYLNSSGEPLHKRGYRTGKIHKAALNESLAAGLVRLSGWEPDQALVDPMCGSGTIPIEAAMIARNQAPGLTRRRFAFQNWRHFDSDYFSELKIKTRKMRREGLTLNISGSDIREDSIEMARNSAISARVNQDIRWKVRNALKLKPPYHSGVMLTNPPYGQRIGSEDELDVFYQDLGSQLKQVWTGYRAFIFTGDLSLPKKIGLRTNRRIPLRNANIECRLLEYQLYEGSLKHPAAEPSPDNEKSKPDILEEN